MIAMKPAQRKHVSALLKEKSLLMVFILPATLTLLLLLLYPFGYGIYVSLFKTNLVNKWAFVGLKNYVDAFATGELWGSLGLTVQFTFFVVLGHMVLGLGLALLLNRNFRGRTLYRALLMLPWLFPEVVAANLWKWILSASTGLINGVLIRAGAIQEPISFLGSTQYAMLMVIWVCVWKGYPLIMLQSLAGLQTIPGDLYEAAKIDGANGYQQFLHVTLPGLRSSLMVMLILDTVWWFKHVTMIWLLTSGGPGSATNVISIDIYKRAFEYLNFGSSSAIAVVVFLICVLISLLYRRMMKSDA
ncbi:MAG: sugar ABC transporter permease [Candidatus Limiplasma sp.]|nr:sugar ABC transporter permease [Candidatus Limiplasma sp.]